MDIGVIIICIAALAFCAVLLAKKCNEILTGVLLIVIIIGGLTAYVMAVPQSPFSVFCTETIAKKIAIDSNDDFEDGAVIWEFAPDTEDENSDTTEQPGKLDEQTKALVDRVISYVVKTDKKSEYYLQFKDSYLCVTQTDGVITAKIVKGELTDECLPVTGESV